MAEPEDTLSEIFSHRTLTVPEYQRGYSWDTRNIEDLTDDLQYFLDEHLDPSKDTEHYLGTWGAREIRNRTDEMVKFAKSRWPVETRAYVQVKVSGDSDSEEIQAEVRTTVRDRIVIPLRNTRKIEPIG